MKVTTETIRVLSELAGIEVPPEDVEPLAAALQSQLAAFAAVDAVPVDDVESITTFDPRWT